jgi:hypothetical protein
MRTQSGKIAIVVIRLVPEAREKDNESISKEIREELESFSIPYAYEIEKVTVFDCMPACLSD